MNEKEKILIFRTCLAAINMFRFLCLEIAEEKFNHKIKQSSDLLRKALNDHLNFLYAQESKSKIRR
jgi:hypothetical protein